jgi:hypothetical protein
LVWTTATMQKYAGYGPIVMSPDGGTVDDGEIRIAASMVAGRQLVHRSPVAKYLPHPSGFFFETLPHDIFSETLPPTPLGER